MSEEILINITPQETRVAVIQQGVVQEVQIEAVFPDGTKLVTVHQPVR